MVIVMYKVLFYFSVSMDLNFILLSFLSSKNEQNSSQNFDVTPFVYVEGDLLVSGHF